MALEPSAAHAAWDWATIPVEKLSEGVERQMIYGDRLMLCRLRFAPRVVTPPHRHPHEQMTLVVSGRARFVVGDQERVVGPGEVLLFPGGFWHGATMLEDEVVLIDIFSPIREDFLTGPAGATEGGEECSRESELWPR